MALKFRTKILLIFVALVLVSSILNMGIAGFAVQNNLTTDLINRIVINTHAEVSDLTNLVLTNNKGGIVSLIFNQKISHKDMAYQLVFDANNQLLASSLINENPDALI